MSEKLMNDLAEMARELHDDYDEGFSAGLDDGLERRRMSASKLEAETESFRRGYLAGLEDFERESSGW